MRLSFDGLWTCIAMALPTFLALVVPLPAVDLAYQVRAGNEILASGSLPGVDTWTFTVWGTPWLDQQWFAQVLLALGHRAGGWELLAVARAALVAASMGLVIATARERGTSPRVAAILALAAFALAAPALALRPQLLGLMLFAWLLYLVAVRVRHPRWYLLAPVLVAVWANVHGSFVLGPAVLVYAWLSDVAWRRPARLTLWVAVIGVLATLVNPFTFDAWTYAAGIGANPAITGQVTEWQRTSPLAVPGILFYPSVVITSALLWRRRDRVRWPDWVLLAAMALMGAWAVRGVAWWAFSMAYLLAGVLAAHRDKVTAPTRAPRPSVVNGVTAVVLGGLVVAALPWWRPPDPLTGRAGLLSYAPSGLARKVAELAPAGARVVVPQTWGSWFEWAAPEAQYFIDSRFELFPQDVWDDYATFDGPAAAVALDRWGAGAIVVPDGRVAPPAPWEPVYSDADGTIFTRGR